MLQEDAWHIIQRTQNIRIGMTTGQYPLRMSETFILNRRASQVTWFGHICHHDMLPKMILRGTVDGSRLRGRPRKSWRDNIKEWTGQSMSPLLRMADDRIRWATITAKASIWLPPKRRLSATGICWIFETEWLVNLIFAFNLELEVSVVARLAYSLRASPSSGMRYESALLSSATDFQNCSVRNEFLFRRRVPGILEDLPWIWENAYAFRNYFN